MNSKIYDALIVGSGASGGWVAKELAEQGMDVLMLEAGPPRFPSRDFTEHTWPYQVRYRGFGNQRTCWQISQCSAFATPATNIATSFS